MPDSAARQSAASRPVTGHVIAADAAALLRVIERAAAEEDPDIERLDRLAAMYERTLAREAETLFTAALVRMQSKLPVLDELGEITDPDGTVQVTYATWEDTVDLIRPILARHGFSLSFRPGRPGDGALSVIGVLRHEAGHKEEAELALPPDATGNKNAVQAVGSAMSYGQRYVAKMLLNLTSRRQDDDDAMAAGKSASELAAIAEIEALEGRPAFLAWKRANRVLLGELPAPAFQRVIAHYGARLRRADQRAEGRT